MSSYTLYHNPRCSKSRQALALLEAQGITPNIRLYLEDPPDTRTLKQLLKSLGLASAHDLLRQKEAEYKSAGLTAKSSKPEIIDAMVRFPKLIERPILVVGNRAVIGRPPEQVLTLLESGQ